MSLKAFTIFITVSLCSLSSWTKDHPFSEKMQNQIQSLFFADGKISNGKVEAYENRLKAKIKEVTSIVIGKEKIKGEVSAPKIEKEISENSSILALRESLKAVQKLKRTQDVAEAYQLAYFALDLEAAIRIEGKELLTKELAKKALTFLGNWKIPVNPNPVLEASNLFDENSKQFLTTDKIKTLIKSGVDLSRFNPDPESTFWEKQNRISAVDVRQASRGETLSIYSHSRARIPDVPVYYFDEIRKSATKPKMDVFTQDQKGKKTGKFKLKFGEEAHSQPTVSALMMTLGFPTDIYAYQRDIKVILGKKTVSDLTLDWESYYRREGAGKTYKIENYIREQGVDPALGNYVIFKEGSVEMRVPEIERLGGWAFADFDHQNFREVRALMLLQMWVDNTDLREFGNNRLLAKFEKNGSIKRAHIVSDVGHTFGNLFQEMPDVFNRKMIESRNQQYIEMKYRSVHSNGMKNVLTYSDVKWASRLISQLSRQQIQTAVQLGGWPQCLVRIYTEKLISRRNDLVQNFGLLGEVGENGQKIELLPQLLDLDTLKIKDVCQSDERAFIDQNYVTDFSFSIDELLQPIAQTAWTGLSDFARQGINGQTNIIIKPQQLGSGIESISEIILNVRRDIEKNPQPKTEKDLYLVQDHFTIGLRLGVEFGPLVESVYTRKFSLAYPVRSMEEARYNNGFLVNALLASDIQNGRLPEKFVLKTEHFFEKLSGLRVNDPISMVSPRIDAGVGQILLSRSILDHRDSENIILYRDRTNAREIFLETSLQLFLLRIPIFSAIKEWGEANGKGFLISQEGYNFHELKSKLSKAMMSGDFSEFKPIEKSFKIKNDFTHFKKDWAFLFWRGSSHKALDKIELTVDDIKKQSLQYQTTKQSSWAFLANKEARKIKVEIYSDMANQTDFQLELSVVGTDINTRDIELAENYISFVNGLSPEKKKLISFNPNLGYSRNQRWGPTMIMSENVYTQEALKEILELDTNQFWKHFARSFGVSEAELKNLKQAAQYYQQNKNSSSLVSPQRMRKSLNLSLDMYQAIIQGQAFIESLETAKRKKTLDSKMKQLAEAFRKVVFVKRNGFYESRILGALNSIVGEDKIYSRNVISSPPEAELNMIESAALFAEIGSPVKNNNHYLVFIPETPSDLYFMFDSWF